MSTPLPRPWTLDDFLVWEAGQPERYEFVDGVVRMMVGGTTAHNTITLTLATALRAALRGSGCRVFSSDVKVVAAETGEAAYPDIVVTGSAVGPAEDRISEPTMIAEVLSRSTADYDRGAKFEMYKAIPTLRHYLLIAQERRRVDLYSRTAAGWELTRLDDAGTVELPGLGCGVGLDILYEDAGC